MVGGLRRGKIPKITKRLIDTSEPKDKAYYVWDQELKGYALKVAPSGRKTLVIKYQLGGRSGPQRWISLGRYGQVTAEHARKEAKRLLGEVASGRDPAKDRKQTKVSFKQIMEEFFQTHVASKKPSTAAYYRDLANKYVLPAFGQRDIRDIERADIARQHQRLNDKPYQANRTLALLSKFFNWCELHGYRPDHSNPCRHIQKYTEKKRKRFLSDAEMARIGEALLEEPDIYAASAIRLLLLTGMRKGEVLQLKWSEVNIVGAKLELGDSKTGAKEIPLSPPALKVLAELPRVAGNPHVIVGKKPGKALVGLKGPWGRLKKRAGLENLRIHDLRHSFASVGVSSQMSLPILGALLGHTQAQTTQRYAHLSDDPLRQASGKIGSQIANALDGKSSGNVVKLSSQSNRS